MRIAKIHGIFLACLALACCVHKQEARTEVISPPEQSCGGRIDVYRWVAEEEPDSIEKTLVGTVIVTGDGRLNLRGPERALTSRLRTALIKIGSRKTLETMIEEPTTRDGHLILAMRTIEVAPGDPAYIWAVAEALAGYGFLCNVRTD